MERMVTFLKNKSYYAGFLLICLIYNVYFIFLVPGVKLHYLGYLDVLAAAGLLTCFLFELFRFAKEEREDREDDAEKLEFMKEELKKQFALNCDLQDYIAKWCHEAKLPLAAALLIAEQLENGREKASLQEQLERMNHLLANALLGCKVQSSLFDLQIRPVSLAECVRASIRNNQFFLVQKHFELDIQVGEEIVYTDKAWLTYVLDQMLSNAVKYAGETARLAIRNEKNPDGEIRLLVEDRGAGIKEDEIRRVFDRGFTGSNYHNGQYKSTGMGLYMAKLITDRLGHGLAVESVYGEYTKFVISFADNREHFLAGQ